MKNPNFSRMPKKVIAAWAKEHHDVEIPTTLSADEMVRWAESLIAPHPQRAAEEPQETAVDQQAPQDATAAPDEPEAPAAATPPAPERAIPTTGTVNVLVPAAPWSGGVPLQVNGRLHTIPIGVTTPIPATFLGSLRATGVQFTIEE